MKKKYLCAVMAALMAATAVCGCSGGASSTATTAAAAEAAAEAAGSEAESAEESAEAASGDVTAAVDTIKIGLVTPLSGDNATYGTKQEKGYQLAMDEINAAGGVYGAQIVLESYDDGGDAATAASGTQKFADDPEIMALGGSCLTSCTAAMLPISGDAGLAQLVVSSSAKSLTGISDYFFRMAVQDAAVGPQIANQFTSMGDTKAVALYPNNDYGTGLKDSFSEQFAANGGEVMETIAYQATDQDFAAILTTVKSLNPDCIALCGTTTDGALIIKQARQMGIEAHIMGQPGIYNQNVIDIAGDAAEGLLCCGVFVATNPDEKVQEFVKKYNDKYNETPDGFAALAYDQMYVIADAAGRAMAENDGELTRETMAEALRATNYEGVTGTVNFDENGDWVRDYLTLQVKDGVYDLYQAE
ncbi:MAG: ABC transporter substrate-binding protein [Enterocloster sp.]